LIHSSLSDAFIQIYHQTQVHALIQYIQNPNYAETVAEWIKSTTVQSDADKEDDDTEMATPPTAAAPCAGTVAPVVDVQVNE
jgi:hypothetical protein